MCATVEGETLLHKQNETVFEGSFSQVIYMTINIIYTQFLSTKSQDGSG